MTLETTDREVLEAARLPLADLASLMRLPAGWAQIPGESARLARLLRAAVDQVEAQTGHATLDRHHVLAGRAGGGPDLSVPLRPLTALVALEVDGAARPVAGARLASEGGRGRITLPRPLVAGASVRLVVRAGFATWEAVPAALAHAVLLAADALDGERASPSRALAARLLAPFRELRLRGAH